MNCSPASSIQHQRKHTGEDLGCCGKAKTHSLELEDSPIQGDPKVGLKIQMDQDLEASVLQIDIEHFVPFLDGTLNQRHWLNLEIG